MIAQPGSSGSTANAGGLRPGRPSIVDRTAYHARTTTEPAITLAKQNRVEATRHDKRTAGSPRDPAPSKTVPSTSPWSADGGGVPAAVAHELLAVESGRHTLGPVSTR